MDQAHTENIVVRSVLSQPIVLAILKNGEKYVMQLRDDKPEINEPNRWGMFGGYREEFEQPERAIRRELQEELGLDVGSLRYAFNYEWANVFIADISEQMGEIVLGEGQAYGSFTLAELAEKANCSRHALRILRTYEGASKVA